MIEVFFFQHKASSLGISDDTRLTLLYGITVAVVILHSVRVVEEMSKLTLKHSLKHRYTVPCQSYGNNSKVVLGHAAMDSK